MHGDGSGMSHPDLLDQLVEAIRDSASQHGTSNGPVLRWVEVATARIQLQSAKIKQLETLLHDVMEHHGLSSGN